MEEDFLARHMKRKVGFLINPLFVKSYKKIKVLEELSVAKKTFLLPKLYPS